MCLEKFEKMEPKIEKENQRRRSKIEQKYVLNLKVENKRIHFLGEKEKVKCSGR